MTQERPRIFGGVDQRDRGVSRERLQRVDRETDDVIASPVPGVGGDENLRQPAPNRISFARYPVDEMEALGVLRP